MGTDLTWEVPNMGRYIIKIKDRYFEWSTVVDAPITYGMTEDELRAYTKDEYGEEGLSRLPERLARVAQNGCSSHVESLADVIVYNRAGPNETRLTEEEIYARYAEAPKEGEEKS